MVLLRDSALTISQLLDDAARSRPTAIAYSEGTAGSRRRLTWIELQREAAGLAAGLVALGLKRGDRVAICAENSIDWITSIHAVFKAGAIAVLVYYDLAPAEIRQQVTHAGSRVMLASPSVLERIETPPGVEITISLGTKLVDRALPLQKVALRATEESRAMLSGRRPAPDDLAALIYTSGTTGGAKGVMLSHRNFCSNADAIRQSLRFSSEDSVLLVLPLHHAMPFIATIVLACMVGASVVIENDLRRIRDQLQEQRPSIFFGVPALYEIMHRNVLSRAEAEGRLEQLRGWQQRVRMVKRRTGINLGPLLFKKIHRALGGNLRFLVSGGAALNPRLAEEFFSLGLPLLQGWGMTEASPVIAVQRFSKLRFTYSRYYENQLGSVGSAIPGVQLRLIDVPEKDIRVAVANEGEVIVRGQNIFQGYWNAPEQTSAAKLDGWLRTGDMARIDPAGNVFLTGRSKYIIVLGSGEKVHPDELEAQYERSELIQDICIVERRSRDKVQVAAVVYPQLETSLEQLKRDGRTPSEPELRRLVGGEIERLGRELASYKRVSSIELTDEPLPKTPLRKVARGKLEDSYAFSVARWLESAEA